MLKKIFKLIPFMFFYSLSPIWAQVTLYDIKNLDLIWIRGNEVQSLLVGDKLIYEKIDYNIISKTNYPVTLSSDKKIVANLPGGVLDIGFSAGNNLQELFFDNLNLVLNSDVNTLSLTKFNLISAEKDNYLNNLTANCTPKFQSGDFLDVVLGNCFTQGEVKAQKGDFPGVLSFEKLTLTVVNNNFTITANLETPASGKAKITGTSKYDEKTKTLTIEVKTAKLGPLNIKKILLKNLAKIKSPNFHVKDSFIIINL